MKNCKFLYFCLALFLAITHTSCDQFAAGSYPYTETYEFRTSEETLLAAIQKFRSENPQYNPPSSFPLIEGPVNDNDYYHHLYFYYPEERKFIKCWIISDIADKNRTYLGFVAINLGSGLANWKQINHDLENTWNEKEKQKFRERILNKIIEKLDDTR